MHLNIYRWFFKDSSNACQSDQNIPSSNPLQNLKPKTEPETWQKKQKKRGLGGSRLQLAGGEICAPVKGERRPKGPKEDMNVFFFFFFLEKNEVKFSGQKREGPILLSHEVNSPRVYNQVSVSVPKGLMHCSRSNNAPAGTEDGRMSAPAMPWRCWAAGIAPTECHLPHRHLPHYIMRQWQWGWVAPGARAARAPLLVCSAQASLAMQRAFCSMTRNSRCGNFQKHWEQGWRHFSHIP
jgi:hypothetical protein